MIDGNYVPSDAALARAYRDCATVTFGDGTGRWASTSSVAAGATCAYGRARRWLERVARRHPSGSDHWQVEDKLEQDPAASSSSSSPAGSTAAAAHDAARPDGEPRS